MTALLAFVLGLFELMAGPAPAVSRRRGQRWRQAHGQRRLIRRTRRVGQRFVTEWER